MLAISARGTANGQWWRRGGSHISEGELHLVHPGAPPRYEQLSEGGAIDVWPLWGADARTLYYVSNRGGAPNVWVRAVGSPAAPRQLTRFKELAQFSPDSREVYYLDGGRVFSVALESRQARALTVTAPIDVDFSREKHEVFRQAWTYLRDNFYDARFHGVDWPRVREAYAPFVAGARTPVELRRILQLMVGELDASHLGASNPLGSDVTETGRLGLHFDPLELARTGHLKVAEVLPLGPADVAGGIRAGDYLTAVEGAPVTATTNLDALLAHRIGRRVEVSVADAPGGAARTVALRPVNAATEKTLLYRQWVETNRAYVARASGGRLGYVHLLDMSAASLQQLYLDLDAENATRAGVVVDVRNNSGGFVNAYALDVFARREYLMMTPRDLSAASLRPQLGQRALGLPTVLVTNRHSLSDAEDFTEGYRALGLGKVVGEPTAGWIIFTWNLPLIDGTVLRLPMTKISTLAGENMERNPRPVDVAVARPVGESYARRDTQLDEAVRTLLQNLRTAPARPTGRD